MGTGYSVGSNEYKILSNILVINILRRMEYQIQDNGDNFNDLIIIPITHYPLPITTHYPLNHLYNFNNEQQLSFFLHYCPIYQQYGATSPAANRPSCRSSRQ